MDNFLKESPDNVVAVNCRAGKGRTGTVICCYLLYCGRFKNPDEVFTYYAKKRFNIGEGVTQPSQKRYVYYFNQLLNQRVHFPLVRNLKSIFINKIPHKNSEGSIRPFFEIYFGNKDQVILPNLDLIYL
jgi:phosphatidylinositol-3,4,5-trisphosphate 3-phosphatase/dual-specificity protein phosphatase PTEN